MRTFLVPVNKTNLERNKIHNIKKNLILKRFKELHKYKLKINPKNYYHNYGLNKYIIITNKNKSRNSDYKYNNISSYNNILKIKKENKKFLTVNNNKKEKEFLLKSLPSKLKNARNNNGILKSSDNDNFTEEYSIWRGKNINEMTHNSIDYDFLKKFNKNYKSIGKIKL